VAASDTNRGSTAKLLRANMSRAGRRKRKRKAAEIPCVVDRYAGLSEIIYSESHRKGYGMTKPRNIIR